MQKISHSNATPRHHPQSSPEKERWKNSRETQRMAREDNNITIVHTPWTLQDAGWKTRSTDDPDYQYYETIQQDILELHMGLLNQRIRHRYLLSRWKEVTNMMLLKEAETIRSIASA